MIGEPKEPGSKKYEQGKQYEIKINLRIPPKEPATEDGSVNYYYEFQDAVKNAVQRVRGDYDYQFLEHTPLQGGRERTVNTVWGSRPEGPTDGIEHTIPLVAATQETAEGMMDKIIEQLRSDPNITAYLESTGQDLRDLLTLASVVEKEID